MLNAKKNLEKTLAAVGKYKRDEVDSPKKIKAGQL